MGWDFHDVTIIILLTNEMGFSTKIRKVGHGNYFFRNNMRNQYFHQDCHLHTQQSMSFDCERNLCEDQSTKINNPLVPCMTQNDFIKIFGV